MKQRSFTGELLPGRLSEARFCRCGNTLIIGWSIFPEGRLSLESGGPVFSVVRADIYSAEISRIDVCLGNLYILVCVYG